MYRTDNFWFGDDYATDCPTGLAGGVLCYNPSPSLQHSLATRILPNSYDLNLLTKFVSVKFTSDPGQYTGCGNTFTESQTTMFDFDPTSPQVVRPWFVRQAPEVVWDFTPGDYYALYVYDAGYYITHGLYINIEGNNIPTSGENVITGYFGPLMPTDKYNPYAFLLFKQDGYLDPSAAGSWYNSTHAPNSFVSTSHIPQFITQLNMTGPVGINWLVATGDEYAAGIMQSRGFVSTCPIFIGQALDRKPRPFLPNPAFLTVQMDLTFQVEELHYRVCCTEYRERARPLTLNPIGNKLLTTSSTRTGLTQNATFARLGYTSESKNFTDDMFTMIALDPDVPFAAVGNESHPLLHQMKINIKNGNFETGDDVITWNGPAPPAGEPHYYYFLLYRHAQPVSEQLMTSYAGDCVERLAGRCLFDIHKAVSDNHFTLVGANWFRAKRDQYLSYREQRTEVVKRHAARFAMNRYRRGVANMHDYESWVSHDLLRELVVLDEIIPGLLGA